MIARLLEFSIAIGKGVLLPGGVAARNGGIGDRIEARTKLRYAWHEFFRRFVMWRCERPLAQDAVEVLTLSAEAIGGIRHPKLRRCKGADVNRPCALTISRAFVAASRNCAGERRLASIRRGPYSLCKGTLGTSLSRPPIVLPSEWSALGPV